MPREPRNIGASVRARLLDRARAERSDFQILLTRYALERLLYRLCVSPHRDRFILKGAMLFATWVADPFRPTRDLDLLGHGDSDAASMAETFRAICGQPVADDGVTFEIAALTAVLIREEAEYGGVRVRTTATIAEARIPIQVDIGFGDAVTPGAVEIDYPALLDAPAPHLRAYPVETVVAEKFEAMVTRGIANSRLKDFYDLWLIARTFEFRRSTLIEAVRRTFERRETALPADIPIGLSEEFTAAWSAQWQTFLGRERMAAAPETFAAVIVDLRLFLLPLVDAGNDEQSWLPGGPWSKEKENAL
ncbi:nucleotidyl transferase AbiEii/AbiGii toxin family protein [Mesorhizobium sp.]|uniref:nucleotidyl transferase AbiEii/AbiGii toxin family protein n=1 Tax=Mesorhizobium sp. TaxID=1871066 RepID=UPI000FE2BB95|nr:nucleotidyl transferase AbiEii/AbiGii toxin family protein [Mesorhizobium sp.]RWN51505.1 MAG: nucleotidyl transferase AbiEii/AbiGii toxin family protein [Mesorhizobium sp.]RWN72174.1 MAG: nucleotidyl transferase AbiEii/AbiGii toxin family protein [Mesorhizobium sp.]RWN73395.1 MAG: nucleotidyl transferase AbiEii/AbiGii toxin family protein [Mesorhizobium sp.]RWN85706.1 MAG: nucleotidyl transferase AbiEii/AbiGii toxin family protein [Mesorhizobium sp.]RWO09436.1 MAG: nucleotidyl transferase A